MEAWEAIQRLFHRLVKKPIAEYIAMAKPEQLLNYVLIDEGLPLITEGIVIEVH